MEQKDRRRELAKLLGRTRELLRQGDSAAARQLGGQAEGLLEEFQ